MGYGDFKNLPRRTASDKVLHDKAFHIAKIRNMMDIKEVMLQYSLSFFLLKSILVILLLVQINLLLKVELCRTSNQQKNYTIIRKFEKYKVYSSFKDNSRCSDYADMQLISTFNKGFRFLLCVIVSIVNMNGLFL